MSKVYDMRDGASLIAQLVKESSSNAGDPGSIPGSGRSAGEGIGYPLQYHWASLVAQLVKNLLQCRRPGFDPWVGKIPGEGKGYPLQYSDLENSTDCIVHRVTKSRTRLSDFDFTCEMVTCLFWRNTKPGKERGKAGRKDAMLNRVGGEVV